MSGEIFFDFNVKPVKKRKSQHGSKENKQDDEEPVESRNERKKQRHKLDEDIWERTDYAKANAMDTSGHYENNQQNDSDRQQPPPPSLLVTRKKSRSGRKGRKKGSSRRRRSRWKERKEKQDWDDIEDASGTLEEVSNEIEDRKERKKRKKRKKRKFSHELDERDGGGRHRGVKSKRKQRPPWQDSEIEIGDDGKEDAIELDEATSLPTLRPGDTARPIESLRIPKPTEDNTTTARCTGSMEAIGNELYGPEPPMKYEMYSSESDKPPGDSELIGELRYWAVLALFIFVLLIYRSFLPPMQCEAAFKQ